MEEGKVEARRIASALGLSPAWSLDDWLLTQEILIGLLGPDLLPYRVTRVSDGACRVSVERCFALSPCRRSDSGSRPESCVWSLALVYYAQVTVEDLSHNEG